CQIRLARPPSAVSNVIRARFCRDLAKSKSFAIETAARLKALSDVTSETCLPSMNMQRLSLRPDKYSRPDLSMIALLCLRHVVSSGWAAAIQARARSHPPNLDIGRGRKSVEMLHPDATCGAQRGRRKSGDHHHRSEHRVRIRNAPRLQK